MKQKIECAHSRLAKAHPGREISQGVWCHFCDPDNERSVWIDADEPRANIERESVWHMHEDNPAAKKYGYPQSDFEKEIKQVSVPRFKMLYPFGGMTNEPVYDKKFDCMLAGHAVFVCTNCEELVISQFAYTHDEEEDDET